MKLIIFLNIAIVLIAVLLKWPQPQLNWDSVEKMISTGNRKPPLNGTIIAVTGATSGIGRALITTVHRFGATVIAIARSPTKLAQLKSELDAGLVSDNDSRVFQVVANNNDLESINRAAIEIQNITDRLDFLVNNAGIHYAENVWYPSSNLSTVQGYDLAFGVNYLSHVLLTEKLLPLLEKSERDPRIIQISSLSQIAVDGSELFPKDGNPPIASRNDIQTFCHRQRSYPNSKLAQVLHTRALSRKLKKQQSPVKVVSVCPGWVSTNLTGGEERPIISVFMNALGYPVYGAGLSSTLNAMFRPGLGEENKSDFISNGYLFEKMSFLVTKLHLTSEWAREYNIRDIFANMMAFGVLLPFQKFFFGEFIVQKSSPESFNVSLQDALYDWSLEAVKDWL